MKISEWVRDKGFFKPKPKVKDNWHYLKENVGFCFYSRFYDVRKISRSWCTNSPPCITAQSVNSKAGLLFNIKTTFHWYDHMIITEIWKKPLVDLKAPWVYVGKGSVQMGYSDCPSKKTQEVMRSIQKVVDNGYNKTLPR